MKPRKRRPNYMSADTSSKTIQYQNNLNGRIERVRDDLEEMAREAGRTPEGRHLNILHTDAEKLSTLADMWIFLEEDPSEAV